MKAHSKEVMKTGYDQFFKKAKEASVKSKPSIDVQKLQQARKKNPKKKSKFPLMQFFMFGLVAIGILFVFDRSDDIEKMLKKVEIGVSFAAAEEKPAAAAEPKAEAKEEPKKDEKKEEAKAEPKPDETDYLFKLAERKKQLDVREEELNRYAAEIAKQKEEIDVKLKKLEETRTKISTALEDKIKADDSKVDTLVQMYSNMKPQQAAKVFETLDEDLVIEILSRMKKKSAADILNLVKAEKAQVLAERYAGYRVPASK
jgi:flagellar motility protein MotE (MotC chaperone)